MRTVVIYRKRTGKTGTFGELEIDGEKFKTGELPWRNNVPGKSCVPAGEYLVEWDPSPNYGFKYELRAVPDRTVILIHAANLMGDEDRGLKAEVDGCIALGGAYGVINGQDAIVGSRTAVERFEALMEKKPFKLRIVDEYLETGAPVGHPFA